MTQEYLKTLEHLAKPLIHAGVYKSEGAFIKDLMRDIAAQKIKTYKRTVGRYEERYGSLDRFSNAIKGRATPKQEDEWMEWEAAANMLKAWKSVAKELGMSAN